MKLEYINPTIRVKEIQLAQMIALSLVDDDADPEGEVLGKEGNLDENWTLKGNDVWED